eukprot:Skav228923  [mRNA]  locus=scaffold3800:79272:82371:+ [translate_table: standard]
MTTIRCISLEFALSQPPKPLGLSSDWTRRVNLEFWAQGDEERRLNLPISRMCDRQPGLGTIPTGQFLFIKHVVEPYMSISAAWRRRPPVKPWRDCPASGVSALVKLCPEAGDCFRT